MPKDWISRTSPLVVVAAASAAALLTTPVPAQALPPAPLAPGDCAQWGFNGPTTLRRDTGETVNFTATTAHADAPGTWNQPNGAVKQGNVVGDIDPNGHVTVTFNFKNGGSSVLTGDLAPSGQANGLSEPDNTVPWHSLAPMKCAPDAAAQAGPKPGPSVDLDPGIGTLTIRVTDKSGVASNCQYHSDFVDRTFDLPANGTFNINVAPAVPMFIDHQVDVTCTNGTSTHTTKFF